MQADALLRLQADQQAVGLAAVEQAVGHRLELDDDLRVLARQALAGAQVEGHAGPAPVVDLHLQGDEGLGVAVVIDVLLEVVGRHFLAADLAGAVLAAHGLVLHIEPGDGLERFEDLHLLVAHRLGVETHRRLHRHQAEQLQQVVLHHVAHGAGLVVVAAAVLHAQGLAHADLHVVDVPGAPDRLEQGIGEAQRHEVLHRLLAQVVVDAEHLGFAEHLADGGVDRPGRLQGMADGLLQHDAVVRPAEPGDLQVPGDVLEQARGDGQVVDAGASLERAEVARQAAEIGALGHVHGEVVQPLGEPGPGLLGELGTGHLGAAMALGQGAVAVDVQGIAGNGEDAQLRMQAAVAMQVIERRQQLVKRQIAGAAKDQHVARLGHVCTPAWFAWAGKRVM